MKSSEIIKIIEKNGWVKCHLEGLLLDGEELPVGESIDKWIDEDDYSDGVWAFVDIDISQISGKARRVNITLPTRVLNLIDLYTKNHSLKNRSAFLTDAAIVYMGHHK